MRQQEIFWRGSEIVFLEFLFTEKIFSKSYHKRSYYYCSSFQKVRLILTLSSGWAAFITAKPDSKEAQRELVDCPTQLTLISHLWIFVFVSISEQISNLQI